MAARKGNKLVYWLMLGLIVLGFGGWFTGGGRVRSTDMGTVGGLELPAQTYANALQAQIRQMEQQTGQRPTMEQIQAMGLDRAVLAQVVTQRVLDAEAQRLGLSVGDIRVADAVRGTPAFQGVDGNFDRDLYREQLRRAGLTEASYENSLRGDTTRTILQAAVLGGVPEPVTYSRILAAYSNEKRSVTWAPVGPEAVTSLPEPTDEDLQAYYDDHPDEFTAPEVRQISYAWLTPDMIQGQMSVSDQEIQDLYNSRLGEFVKEERRLVERLVFPDEQAAQAAKGRLDSGDVSFDALVEERGLLLSDIDLGDVSRSELDGAGDAVFGAASGSVVGPLPTGLGPALFRINAVIAADETTLEEATPDLRNEIANEKAQSVIADLRSQVEDLTAGGATIEDLAERTDLEPGQIDWSEGMSDGPAAYQEFRDAAAAAREGDFPKPVDLSDGGLMVLRLDGVTPAELRPLDEVAADVRAGWDAQARREAVLAAAKAQAEAISAGARFEDQGLTPETEPALTRRGAVEGTPPDFVSTAFSLAQGEARALPVGDGAVVLRLDSITTAPEDDPAVVAERTTLASQISGAISRDIFDAFARQLQAGTEIRINDQAVAAVNGQIN
ncbi:peptidyl-prolyl cis-trans isomerase [Rubellimicrobium arenae]|uniref:peptidyl-prolyl cis-trans isomerase n=1 Tax=Rubellimicrobium arenae TaxID=2817372 RepID=UPI001B30A317|nr:peptidyl-prolyl cis-trans isomerase [Rubellimicrobium arenae]